MTWVYPAIMLSAVGTAVALSRRTQGRLRLTRRERWAISLGAFCGAMIGAKLPFALTDPQGLASGAAWFENGKTIIFGLVGGYFGVEAAKWAMHITIKTGDSFAAPVAAAIAVGRLACFSAGCCRGTPTDLPWAAEFDGVSCHPTQLYEFAFHMACAAILVQMQARGVLRGQLIKLYILVYLAYRFATEFIRPEPKLWLDLSVYQWAAILFAPIFVLLWLRDRRPGGALQTAT